MLKVYSFLFQFYVSPYFITHITLNKDLISSLSWFLYERMVFITILLINQVTDVSPHPQFSNEVSDLKRCLSIIIYTFALSVYALDADHQFCLSRVKICPVNTLTSFDSKTSYSKKI